MTAPSGPAHGRDSIQPIPAVTRNMATIAKSKRPKSSGAESEKKLVPRIASGTGSGGAAR